MYSFHIWLMLLFIAVLYESTGRTIALPPALAAVALTKMLKLYIKVFKTLYFLSPQMDLVYTWYDYRCWSKILLSTIHIPAYDLEVKVTNLKLNVFHKFEIKSFLSKWIS